MTLTHIESGTVLEARGLSEAGTLFAILDATNEPRVPERVHRMGSARAVSLYANEAADALSAICPYLVRVDPPTFDWIAEVLWADPWGIFAVAPVDLQTLRSHFRRLLTIRGPTDEEVLFRFYDPRVLAAFLPTCSIDQLDEVFGPVERLVWTDWETYGTVHCQRAGAGAEDRPTQPRIVLRRQR